MLGDRQRADNQSRILTPRLESNLDLPRSGPWTTMERVIRGRQRGGVPGCDGLPRIRLSSFRGAP